eukprot:6186415-Pleurochrysis_carterae.AAC.4
MGTGAEADRATIQERPHLLRSSPKGKIGQIFLCAASSRRAQAGLASPHACMFSVGFESANFGFFSSSAGSSVAAASGLFVAAGGAAFGFFSLVAGATLDASHTALACASTRTCNCPKGDSQGSKMHWLSS